MTILIFNQQHLKNHVNRIIGLCVLLRVRSSSDTFIAPSLPGGRGIQHNQFSRVVSWQNITRVGHSIVSEEHGLSTRTRARTTSIKTVRLKAVDTSHLLGLEHSMPSFQTDSHVAPSRCFSDSGAFISSTGCPHNTSTDPSCHGQVSVSSRSTSNP